MPQARPASDAKTVLSGLIGKTIPTLTGKPNRIIRLEDDHVFVGTTRSPQGRPVNIAELQTAIDRLYADRELAITVHAVGYRSAFVGAVLRQLPNAHHATNPRRIWIATTP